MFSKKLHSGSLPQTFLPRQDQEVL